MSTLLGRDCARFLRIPNNLPAILLSMRSAAMAQLSAFVGLFLK
jgi:hypothetical protein